MARPHPSAAFTCSGTRLFPGPRVPPPGEGGVFDLTLFSSLPIRSFEWIKSVKKLIIIVRWETPFMEKTKALFGQFPIRCSEFKEHRDFFALSRNGVGRGLFLTSHWHVGYPTCNRYVFVCDFPCTDSCKPPQEEVCKSPPYLASFSFEPSNLKPHYHRLWASKGCRASEGCESRPFWASIFEASNSERHRHRRLVRKALHVRESIRRKTTPRASTGADHPPWAH